MAKLESYDRNEWIRSAKVRLINSNGENVGVVPRDEALQMAKAQELDLVLISPRAEPPVAKIMEWSKFKYEQNKKKRDAKGKKTEVKEMWFKPKIEQGDIDHKLKRVKEFLQEGDRVKLTIKAKGRVNYIDLKTTMDKVLASLGDSAITDGFPRSEGRNLAVFVKKP